MARLSGTETPSEAHGVCPRRRSRLPHMACVCYQGGGALLTCPIFFLRCHWSERPSRCSNTLAVISPYATFFTSCSHNTTHNHHERRRLPP